MNLRIVATGALLLLFALPAPARAQIDPDLQIDLVETDFALSSMPTTLRMPAGKFAFRLTHRFSRPIAEDDAGDFFADLFGFDSAAKIGLELRYGVRPGLQATFYRTNDRTIQLLGQQQIVRQEDERALTAHAVVAVEGANNFSENFSTAIGAVLARRIGEQAKVYAHPILVLNANPAPSDVADEDHTFMLGLGGRLRLGQSLTYIVVEATPRLTGYAPGSTHATIAIEKQYGGHVFQLNVSTNLGTTMRQIARGGPDGNDWFIGFNLSRRFF